MRKCSAPDIWVPGTKSPYKKGYCTSVKTKIADVKKTDCNKPSVWVPGTKSPFKKGYCVAPVIQKTPTPVKQKTPTPVKQKTPTPVKQKTPTPVKQKALTPVVKKIPTPILKKSNCVKPNTWIPGTKSPFKKGYCKISSGAPILSILNIYYNNVKEICHELYHNFQ